MHPNGHSICYTPTSPRAKTRFLVIFATFSIYGLKGQVKNHIECKNVILQRFLWLLKTGLVVWRLFLTTEREHTSIDLKRMIMESWCAQLAQFYTKCVVFNMTEIMMGVFAENVSPLRSFFVQIDTQYFRSWIMLRQLRYVNRIHLRPKK